MGWNSGHQREITSNYSEIIHHIYTGNKIEPLTPNSSQCKPSSNAPLITSTITVIKPP
jgi:hypothetical protein